MPDIVGMLTGGDPRSLHGVEEAIAHASVGEPGFAALFECLFSADEIVRMRAADALEKVARVRPELFAGYTQRLLSDVASIDQPSVQWHLAQMAREIDLTKPERAQAIEILRRNLERYDDWIVLTLTLATLAQFAQHDPELRSEMIPILERHQADPRKAVAKRATKLRERLVDRS